LKRDFDEVGSRMKKMGAIMDTETALSFKALSDEMGMLTQIVVSHLGPALLWFAEHLYKGGGVLAGWAAKEGAATARMSVGEMARWYPGAALKGLAGMGGIAGPGIRALGELLLAGGLEKKYDVKAGREAGKAAQEEWLGPLDAMKKRIAEESERLRHPAAPDFGRSSLVKPMSRKELEMGGADAMVRAGNFLGGMGIAQRIEERKVELLQQIARNTAATCAARMMVTAAGGLMGGVPASLMGGPIFPPH